MKIHLLETPYRQALSDRQVEDIEKNIRKAYLAARKHLELVPEHVNFVVDLNTWDPIAETGESARAISSWHVNLVIHPEIPYGLKNLLMRQRSSVFHELNHCAAYEAGKVGFSRLIDNMVMEGLASVFERDYADSETPPWAHYNATECRDWLVEVIELSGTVNQAEYMFNHPDGRKWVGYKVGCLIVDEAVKNSGKSVMELTEKVSIDQIIEYSGLCR